MEMKRCTGPCGLEKEATEENFYWRNDIKRWKNKCKTCMLKDRKIYYDKNSEQVKAYNKERYNENKETIIEKQKQYHHNNKNNINAKRRDKYVKKPKQPKKSKAELAEYQKEYRQKYKEELNKDKKEYIKERRKTDLVFKMRINISSLINHELKRNGSSKNNRSCLKHLPYTIPELYCYIETLFEWWMNKYNHGVYKIDIWKDDDPSTWTWQIDHIIPQSDLPYTSMEDENFKKCWAFENLRPYSGKQNLLDGANRIRHRKKS